jgi:hypothetical protein
MATIKVNYMLNKEKLIESIKNMPEDVFGDIDVLLDRIILLEKIENGLKDVKEGNVISEKEMGAIIESWFQK